MIAVNLLIRRVTTVPEKMFPYTRLLHNKTIRGFLDFEIYIYIYIFISTLLGIYWNFIPFFVHLFLNL